MKFTTATSEWIVTGINKVGATFELSGEKAERKMHQFLKSAFTNINGGHLMQAYSKASPTETYCQARKATQWDLTFELTCLGLLCKAPKYPNSESNIMRIAYWLLTTPENQGPFCKVWNASKSHPEPSVLHTLHFYRWQWCLLLSNPAYTNCAVWHQPFPQQSHTWNETPGQVPKRGSTHDGRKSLKTQVWVNLSSQWGWGHTPHPPPRESASGTLFGFSRPTNIPCTSFPTVTAALRLRLRLFGCGHECSKAFGLGMARKPWNSWKHMFIPLPGHKAGKLLRLLTSKKHGPYAMHAQISTCTLELLHWREKQTNTLAAV